MTETLKDRPRKKLSQSPAAIGRTLSKERDEPVPEEILDASASQLKAMLTAYRERIDVLRAEGEPGFELWCAGDPAQARSISAVLDSLGAANRLLGERATGPHGRQCEGLLVAIGALEASE